MTKKLPLIIFLITSTIVFSQNKREILYGKVIDSVGILVNVHIVNTNTNKGTYTNSEGLFRIFAKEKDTLQISSIGFTTELFIIESENLGLSSNTISLKKTDYELEEVIIKKHKLTGSLELDFKQVPKDTIKELVDNMVDGIKKIDFSTPIIQRLDYTQSKFKPPIVLTDPIDLVLSRGLFFGTKIPLSNSKNKVYSKINLLEGKKIFPKRILALLGNDFFFKELNIPKEQYYHFIDYCSYKNIEKLFKQENILELIRIFKEESISYHKNFTKE